jgi:hypothetical protein
VIQPDRPHSRAGHVHFDECHDEMERPVRDS